MPASKIFTGFRALGYVSNHIPLQVRHHRKHKENYVITCVGKSFHTYNCSKLGIVSISNTHQDDISCLAVDANLVFTGCRNKVQAFQRGKQVLRTYEGHEYPVHLLLPFGNHLISVDTGSNVKVWDIHSEGIYLEMNFDNSGFQVTAVMHPHTYLNKLVLGSKQGTLQLWNIKQDKMLYVFEGWNSAVTCLEQSPAMDVIAIGLADGQIIIHNLKFDETVMKFRQDWGPVTTISFRTDGHPMMVTGSTIGHIALWDLESKKLKSQIRDAHEGSVVGMQCLPNEPLMVTNAADNSLKVWIFDQPDGGGRLLRQRSGHSAPPNKVQHYDNNGKNILSAGQDSTLRSFSVIHDKHNKSLGRASYDKKESKKTGLKKDRYMMPPITQFSSDTSRQSDWDNIAACHRGKCLVTTWSFQRSTMGAHKLKHPRFDEDPKLKLATALCTDISPCGNFVVIGYSTGHVDKYNLQSAIHRGCYGETIAHNCSVRGIAIDGLNQITITAGLDGEVKFWKFKQKNLIDTCHLKCCISDILLHRESAMLAVSLDDFRIMIIDTDTRKIVRTFQGHHNAITDMTFSPDARWLITASMDSTVRTWDLPTGKLIDCFLVSSAATSLSLSPTGDFLATSHVDDIGVYLWSNMTLYTFVSLRPLPEDYEPDTLELPATQYERKETDEEDEKDDKDMDDYELSEFKSPEQLSDELITLSLLPNSRWQNLLNLDIIKKRNKPKEAPRVPKSAPFFIPTIAGLEPKFASIKDDTEKETKSRISIGNLEPLSELGKALMADDLDYDKILNRFKELGPSAIDLEIRSLSPEGGGSVKAMERFLMFCNHILYSKNNFELINAYLGLFLKVHGDTIASNPTLCLVLETLSSCHLETWRNLQDLFTQNTCMVNYLRTATL
ncbi:UTP21 [Mytilus coruscus]|uniref:UTP21 n=1 Tax=Mytilus coruscus TaxID=42192 RepID=A0A6J8AV64_MYTCO|nr:UTP21 [Mytilus coruscus]